MHRLSILYPIRYNGFREPNQVFWAMGTECYCLWRYLHIRKLCHIVCMKEYETPLQFPPSEWWSIRQCQTQQISLPLYSSTVLCKMSRIKLFEKQIFWCIATWISKNWLKPLKRNRETISRHWSLVCVSGTSFALFVAWNVSNCWH